MSSPTALAIRSVVILEADRLYAEVLRQFTTRAFPRAHITDVSFAESAALALAAEPADIFVAGISAAMEGDVLDLLWRRAAHSPRDSRTLVVTPRRDYRLLGSLRTLAVDGVFDSATEIPDQLGSALHTVAQGGRYWSPSILQHMQRPGAAAMVFRVLTAFEQIVLSVIGDGSDDNTAARELGVSPATVSTVRRDLHRKLGVQHRGELVRVAAQQGFVRFTSAGTIRPGFAMLTASYRTRKTRRSTGSQPPFEDASTVGIALSAG
jgi:DNA-binding NarL/FixJ family response regulator